MITETFSIEIPYITGQSVIIFPLIASICVVMIVKWLIDILP